MQAPSFITIEKSLEKAMYYRDSPSYVNGSLYFGGVHLLPLNENPYIQRTYSTEGIELEDYSVFLKDLCGNELYRFNEEEFSVVNVFNDENGIPQIDWELRNVDFDAGEQLIYLEIQQLPAGETFYTSPFMLTNESAKYTSRWDYTYDKDDRVFSTGLRIWFKEYGNAETLTSYTPVATGTPISFSNNAEYEVWQSSLVFRDLLRLFYRMRQCTYVYCDYVRTMPYEAMEVPERVGGENFTEVEMSLVRFENDTYDPLYVQPVPPEPVPPLYNLVLDSVFSPDGNSVTYNFSWTGFDPTVFTLEYSVDNVVWQSLQFANASGANAPLPGADNNNYYYRVRYYPLDLTSNVLQLPQPTLVLNQIQGYPPYIQSGTRYDAYYTAIGFTVVRTPVLEVSYDGVFWQETYYGLAISNPKTYTTPSSGNQFTYFRLTYYMLGLTSNVIQYEL